MDKESTKDTQDTIVVESTTALVPSEPSNTSCVRSGIA